MSYALMDQIANDPDFQARVSACVVEQSNSLKDDERPDVSNLAYDCLRGADHAHASFYRLGGVAMGSPGPGIESRKPGDPDLNPVDAITDEMILDYVKEMFPIIASMWYSADGSSWSGAWIPAPPEESIPSEEVLA